MNKCHSYHMKAYPNKVKVTLTFSDQEMYLVQYLSGKYSKGCLAEFSHDVVMQSIKDDFQDDIKAIHALKPTHGSTTRTADIEGTSPTEE